MKDFDKSKVLCKSRYCHVLACPPSKHFAIYHSRIGTVMKASHQIVKLLNDFKTPTQVSAILNTKIDKPAYTRTIKALFSRKFLVENLEGLASDEELLCELQSEREDQAAQGQLIRSLRLNVSLSCNYACDYCSQSILTTEFCRQERSAERKHRSGSSLMPWSVAASAINEFLELTADREKLTIRFFGGEPLLNWPVIKKAISLIRTHHSRKDMSLFVNTNGSFIDDRSAAFLAQHRVHVLVSLDGPLPANFHRRTKTGKETYTATVEAIERLIRQGADVGLLAVVCDQTERQLEELIFFAADKGIVNIDASEIRFTQESGTDTPRWKVLAKKLLKTRRFARQYGVGFGGFWSILRKAADGLDFCGGLGRELCIEADGSVYPCYALPMKLGHVGGLREVPNSSQYRELTRRVVGRIPQCAGCDVEVFCAGQCPADAISKTGDLYSVPTDKCAFWRMTLRGVIGDLVSQPANPNQQQPHGECRRVQSPKRA